MPSIEDLINSAMSQQPTKFASAFDDIMGAKAIDAIETMRSSIAQGIYSEEDDIDPEDDIDDEFDDEDDDDFDDDIDDIDLDDEELDLDELEGLEDDGEDA
jgi:hypothetical protein